MDSSDVITEIGNKKRQTFFEEGNEFSLVFTKSEVALGHLGTAKCDSQHERERGYGVPDVAVTKSTFGKRRSQDKTGTVVCSCSMATRVHDI